MVNYLENFKKKCNLTDDFINIIASLFDKLVDFGYITTRQENKLQQKLYNNIDTVLFGNDISVDYKSGYYDAIKKELYIKDPTNVEAIYLRILYAITTNEISKYNYEVGYSTAIQSSQNYKIIHKNFSINRAIISNLVCRLLYACPTTLSIVPTYRTYENDFLGNKLKSDNDIYFLEAKILNQICYAFDISIENLYINLFTNSPIKYFYKSISNLEEEKCEQLLFLFDTISKNYSSYNKLCFLNVMLDKNYIEMKKNILNKDITSLKKEEQKIKNHIKSAILKLHPELDDIIEENVNIENSISEQIYNLENNILEDIDNLQIILVNYTIKNWSKNSTIEYIIRLKELEKIIISQNELLSNTIYNTITKKLLNSNDVSDSNYIQKIKYSLINELLATDKFEKIFKELSFKQILTSEDNVNSDNALVATTIGNSFVQLVAIKDLNSQAKSIHDNTISIQIDNLKYLLDTPSANKDIRKIEELFSDIRSKYTRFSKLRIENFYLFNYNSKDYILILGKDSFNVLSIKRDEQNTEFKLLKLSDCYKIFNLTDYSKLPIVYTKRKRKNKILKFVQLLFS